MVSDFLCTNKRRISHLHHLEIVLRTWNDLEMFGSLTLPTLALIDNNGGMDKNIIYAVLHEAIYCQG